MRGFCSPAGFLLAAISLTQFFAPILRAESRHEPIAESSSNAVWIGMRYVVSPAKAQTVPDLCAFMAAHRVDYWFVNVGKLDATGKLTHNLPALIDFLDATHRWEKAHRHNFHLLAWFNGSTDPKDLKCVDVGRPEVRATIVEEGRRLFDPRYPQSYLAGAVRGFDGVQLDLEPCGGDDVLVANMCKLEDELHAGLGRQSLTSFCAQKCGTDNRYWWTPGDYQIMAAHVDLLCAMSYDSGKHDSASYTQWMQDQTTTILRAMSSTHRAKLFMGFPAYPANKWHDPQIESVVAAAQGTKDGLAALRTSEPKLLDGFGGAAIYAYTGGDGNDHYSSPADWSDFGTYWLAQPTQIVVNSALSNR